jgi:1,4-alpha-glucan branching enzyme
MWAHPGKKLLFMGGEIAQRHGWDHDSTLDWPALELPAHQGVSRLVQDLNRLYRDVPALHRHDMNPQGFAWLILDDTHNNVFAFLRIDGHDKVLAISNFSAVSHYDYRVGVSDAGYWRECLNTDAREYGGSGLGNHGGRHTLAHPAHHHAQSLTLTLPALTTLFFQYQG